MTRKGVILAGGTGSRLQPLTMVVSKQMLPVYDKPMIYYPLTTLMLAGIRDVLVISTLRDTPRFQELLGDGARWGLRIDYAVQNEPRGIADALLIGEDYVAGDEVALILGDNIFYGHGLTTVLEAADTDGEHATIFAYRVRDPQRYGVIELDPSGSPLRILEKPNTLRSHLAVTGLYFYPKGASELVHALTPSDRNELEITDLNAMYLDQGILKVRRLHRGFAWLDTGTQEALHHAASFVQTVQERQGLLIASPDEIAWRLGYIDQTALAQLATAIGNSDYAQYLMNLVRDSGHETDEKVDRWS